MAGRATAPAAAVATPRPVALQVAADLFELTKPKVQSLLLFTTVTTMLVAGCAPMVTSSDPHELR